MKSNLLDKLEFMKYNDIKIRHNTRTDFYTEQSVEKIKYNVDSMIKNLKEVHKEAIKID